MGMPKRWMAGAILGGALLAAIPILAFDRALNIQVENHARGRLEVLARSSLGLAEMRLEQVINTLVDLAAAGVDDCGQKSIAAMQKEVFHTANLKGVGILDDQGRILCTDMGMPLELPSFSREYALPGERLALSVARFRLRNERAVRLRLERPGGQSLSAIVSAEALLPDAVSGEESGSRRLRLLLESGEVIATRPTGDGGAGLEEVHSLAVQWHSERYPIAIIAGRSRSTLATEYHDVMLMARLGAALFVAFALIFVLLSVRRTRDDPVSALKRAIACKEIVPFYQPTVDTRNGRVRGAEVLARWRRPDGTLVSPAHFIPLAEQSGLIYELTHALMKRARDEVAVAYSSRSRLQISFNLFAGHLTDARIVNDLKEIFGDSSLAFEQIVLEITERAPLPDLDEARGVIAKLQALGTKVAIDDVGTGHGGLSYLLKLGVDIIKIDKMFIDAISTERFSQTIIETLVELARTMGMEVIAEGVETFEQLEYLRHKGVNEAQGYVFAPPLPASSYLALIEAMERPSLDVVSSAVVARGAAA